MDVFFFERLAGSNDYRSIHTVAVGRHGQSPLRFMSPEVRTVLH